MASAAAHVVYVLCAMTSIACAALLLRGYFRTGTRLLLWSGLCFAGLALNNILLNIDVAIGDTYSLEVWRHLSNALSICLLVFGLVWDSD